MTYKLWVDLFGRTTDDKKLQNALDKVGITRFPQIEKDEYDVTEDINGEGMSLVFTDASLLNEDAFVEGTVVLTRVLMILQHSKSKDLYKGSLPFELQLDDSRTSLLKRFGEPVETNEMFCWDEWKVENLVLIVFFSEDYQSITRLTVGMPYDEKYV